jgi:hypothetical protein
VNCRRMNGKAVGTIKEIYTSDGELSGFFHVSLLYRYCVLSIFCFIDIVFYRYFSLSILCFIDMLLYRYCVLSILCFIDIVCVLNVSLFANIMKSQSWYTQIVILSKFVDDVVSWAR